jgi:hypothetical protein
MMPKASFSTRWRTRLAKENEDYMKNLATVLRTYPAISAALASVANVALCYFGLKITGEQLVGVVSVVTFVLGMVTHSNVTPLARLAKRVAPAVLADVAPTVLSAIASEAGPELAQMEAEYASVQASAAEAPVDAAPVVVPESAAVHHE